MSINYLEALVPLLDSSLVVRGVCLQEVHVFLCELVFAYKAAHCRFCEQRNPCYKHLEALQTWSITNYNTNTMLQVRFAE